MANKESIEEFIKKYKSEGNNRVLTIASNNLAQLKATGSSIEDLLNHLIKNHQVLLHGSRINISDNYLRPGVGGKLYCSNLASIAIMKAIISNKGLSSPGLEYPYFIDKDNPLEIKIHRINHQTLGDRGFVYILNHKEGFENNPNGSWQYVQEGSARIIAKIFVDKKDFKYPILDVTNSISISFA